MTTTETYDFIIVGAGSAGCVLANRLTANGQHKVLLLEAGPEGHPLSRIPISYGKLLDNPAANWCYRSQPELGTNNREIPVPRGRLLGGSSSINGLVFVRGQALDYDTWGQLGNRGWSYSDVLPYFRSMENYENRNDGDELRGQGGLLHVSESVDRSPLYDALFAAGEEIGLPRNQDYNGDDQEGMCTTQTTIRNGRRMSAAYCYLEPARKRDNLKVQARALAHELILEDRRCVGVRYAVDNDAEIREARANREVVLSAGSINSPQLLELSGIGRPEVLQAQGIEVKHELLGVGQNLRDHIAPRMIWQIKQSKVTYNDRGRGLGLVWQILRYATTRRGLLSIPSGPVLAFFRSREGLATPDVQLHFVPFAVTMAGKRELAKEPGLTIAVYQLRPESTGSVHIQSAQPQTDAAIRFNFLSNELDRITTIEGVKGTRRIVETSAMDAMRGAELQPGADIQSDDEILEWTRETAVTAFHPVGTCKMGSDPMAVVDERLKVHGLQGLRIVDGSIMPTLISGNTNAPCIMIGEKGSDMILAEQ